MLFRVNVCVDVPLSPVIWVKLPTAYITPLHATTCRICSVVPVGASAGVPVTGLGDAGPLGVVPLLAAATPGIRPAALAVSAHNAATGALRSNQRPIPCIIPPFAPHGQRGHQSPRCRTLAVLCSFVS